MCGQSCKPFLPVTTLLHFATSPSPCHDIAFCDLSLPFRVTIDAAQLGTAPRVRVVTSATRLSTIILIYFFCKLETRSANSQVVVSNQERMLVIICVFIVVICMYPWKTADRLFGFQVDVTNKLCTAIPSNPRLFNNNNNTIVAATMVKCSNKSPLLLCFSNPPLIFDPKIPPSLVMHIGEKP
ncbi:hypothetical protein JHK87_009889 [Glycine soja]|nr:hypothetical protein JHK87_009889 [Glycine soja]